MPHIRKRPAKKVYPGGGRQPGALSSFQVVNIKLKEEKNGREKAEKALMEKKAELEKEKAAKALMEKELEEKNAELDKEKAEKALMKKDLEKKTAEFDNELEKRVQTRLTFLANSLNKTYGKEPVHHYALNNVTFIYIYMGYREVGGQTCCRFD